MGDNSAGQGRDVTYRTGPSNRSQGASSGDELSTAEPLVIDVYARLSKAENGETVNVDEQGDTAKVQIEGRGAVVGKVWKDNHKSAWKRSVVRPNWNEAMARLESGESDGIWVLDVSRFSRKIMEGERLIEAAARGIKVWSLNQEYDLATADGRAAFREAMVKSAAESDKISERTRRGMERRVKRGRHTGGTRGYGIPGNLPAPPGWEKGDPRTPAPARQVEAEREVIRECYRRLLAGDTMAELERDLNRRKIKTTNGYDWDRNNLRQMLSRPAIAGLVEKNGAIRGERVGLEPIVPREDYFRLMSMFAARKRGRPAGRGEFLLAGLLRCPACGQALTGKRRPDGKPYPDGEPLREYRCRRSAARGNCGKNYIEARIAENAVAEAVKQRMGDPDRADRIAERLVAVRGDRARIGREIRRLDEDADTLAERVSEWGTARVDKALAPLLARLKELHKELAALDEPEAVEAAAASATQAWDDAAARDDKDAMRAMIKRAFPRLAIQLPRRWGDHSVTRFDWDGETLP